MLNVDIKEGFLCADARLFQTRSGRPKVTFRLGTPRSKDRPPKSGPPANVDFVSVVAYGDRWLDLHPELLKHRHVLVVGFTQSRDLPDGRVATETVAERITAFDDFRPAGDEDRVEEEEQPEMPVHEDDDDIFAEYADD